MRSKLIPTKRKYLEWEIIKVVAFAIVVAFLLYQSYQIHQFINAPTSAITAPYTVEIIEVDSLYFTSEL